MNQADRPQLPDPEGLEACIEQVGAALAACADLSRALRETQTRRVDALAELDRIRRTTQWIEREQIPAVRHALHRLREALGPVEALAERRDPSQAAALGGLRAIAAAQEARLVQQQLDLPRQEQARPRDGTPTHPDTQSRTSRSPKRGTSLIPASPAAHYGGRSCSGARRLP